MPDIVNNLEAGDKKNHVHGYTRCIPSLVRKNRSVFIVTIIALVWAMLFLVFYISGETAGAAFKHAAGASQENYKYTPNAPREIIADEAQARAYALRFLESRYVQCADAQNAAITFEQGEWVVAAHAPAKVNQPLLRFDENGVISFFDHTFSIGQTRPSANPYDENSIEEGRRIEIWNFMYQFADYMLPGVSYESYGMISDVTDERGRYITFSTGNIFARNVHRFVVQVEPVLKIMAFELTADKRLSVYALAQTPLPEQLAGNTLTDYVLGLEVEKGPFFTWSLGDKAALSMQMPVLYAKYKEKLGDYTLMDDVRAHTHGVPDDAAITQEETLIIAQNALKQYLSVDMGELSALETYYGFYVDDSSAPIWEVIFAKRTVPQYTVTIGARTGKIVCLYGANQGLQMIDPLAAGGRQSVPKEGAIALAQNALTAYLGMSSDEVAGLKVVMASYIENDSIWMMRGIYKPFWVVGFAIKDGMDYSVLLDAKTGMILVVHEPGTISNG